MIMAELKYALSHEWVKTPEDFYFVVLIMGIYMPINLINKSYNQPVLSINQSNTTRY